MCNQRRTVVRLAPRKLGLAQYSLVQRTFTWELFFSTARVWSSPAAEKKPELRCCRVQCVAQSPAPVSAALIPAAAFTQATLECTLPNDPSISSSLPSDKFSDPEIHDKVSLMSISTEFQMSSG
jgi:hypothetical protein